MASVYCSNRRQSALSSVRRLSTCAASSPPSRARVLLCACVWERRGVAHICSSCCDRGDRIGFIIIVSAASSRADTIGCVTSTVPAHSKRASKSEEGGWCAQAPTQLQRRGGW